MACSKCSYVLEVFDDTCPRCSGAGVPSRQEKAVKPSKWPLCRRHLKKLSLCLAICLVLCLSVRAFVLVPLFKSYTLAQSDNVQEAVLRHTLQHHNPKTMFFIWIEGHDPTDALLGRLSDIPHSLRKGSESKRVRTYDIIGGQSVDKLTNEFGWDISIGDVRWLSPYKAEVSYFKRTVASKCLVVKQKEGWAVERDDTEWMA